MVSSDVDQLAQFASAEIPLSSKEVAPVVHLFRSNDLGISKMTLHANATPKSYALSICSDEF